MPSNEVPVRAVPSNHDYDFTFASTTDAESFATNTPVEAANEARDKAVDGQVVECLGPADRSVGATTGETEAFIAFGRRGLRNPLFRSG